MKSWSCDSVRSAMPLHHIDGYCCGLKSEQEEGDWYTGVYVHVVGY